MSDRLRPDRATGVFETLLVVDGLPIELQAHLERLTSSVRDLFARELPAGTRDLVLDSASPLPLGRVRLTVAPGRAGVLGADAVAASVDPEDVFPSWERAIVLRPLLMRGGLGAHKWADRAGLAWTSSESDRCLPLVLDAGGELLEASRANVFAVEGEALITPLADGRILSGVARARTRGSADDRPADRGRRGIPDRFRTRHRAGALRRRRRARRARRSRPRSRGRAEADVDREGRG
jgi:para-aminobenzoate synthetase / 4-amino-4-deoxychorismate lyase